MRDFIYYSDSWEQFVFCDLPSKAANSAYQAAKCREVYVRVPRGNLGPLGYSEKIEAARRSITELDTPTVSKPDGPLALTVPVYSAHAVFPWGYEFLSHGESVRPGFVVSDPLSGFWICEAVHYGGQADNATFRYSAKPYFS